MEYVNLMKEPRIDKVVVHICVGHSGEDLVKAEKLLNQLTGVKPIRTISEHRVPAWGLKKGEPIGCKATLRKAPAIEFLKKGFTAKENILPESCVDKQGNLAFGIHEYIDIPGAKYDPEVGIFGMNINATIERPGYRIKRRHLKSAKVPVKNLMTKNEAMEFLKEKFSLKFE